MAVVENGLDCNIVENGFENLNLVVVENGTSEVSQNSRRVRLAFMVHLIHGNIVTLKRCILNSSCSFLRVQQTSSFRQDIITDLYF